MTLLSYILERVQLIMSEAIKYGKKQSEKLEIVYDESCESPREFQNFSIIATVLQRNHTIGDFEFNNSDELKEYLKEQKPVYQMKLYIYEHSGISLECFEDSPKYPYDDQWDAGCIGVVFTTKKLLKDNGMDKLPKENIIKQMKAEVKLYSDWCNGDCYGYRLVKLSKCDKCDQSQDEEIDSCYGFYGYDHAANGLYDAIIENSKVFKTHEDIEELLI